MTLSLCAFAQERESSTMFGIGNRTQWDTYLSNERYHGASINVLTTKDRPTHWLQRKVYVQHMTQGDIAYCKQRAGNHKSLNGFFHWQVAWQYHFVNPNSQWEFNAGPGIQTNIGFVYNTMGGNNPASARASLNVIGSAQGKYHFAVHNKKFTALLQADVPLSGIMFSPYYGQSYYEIFSLGEYHHNVCYTFPFRAFQANTLLAFDWHIKPTTSVRFGYQGMFMQSHVNKLKTQDFSHNFLIGYVRNF